MSVSDSVVPGLVVLDAVTPLFAIQAILTGIPLVAQAILTVSLAKIVGTKLV